MEVLQADRAAGTSGRNCLGLAHGQECCISHVYGPDIGLGVACSVVPLVRANSHNETI